MNEIAPPGVSAPGNVTHHKPNGDISKKYSLDLKLSYLFKENKSLERVNIVTTDLGYNIYESEKRHNKENFDPFSNAHTTQTQAIEYNPGNSVMNTDRVIGQERNSVDNIKSPISQERKDYVNDENRKKNVEVIKMEFGQLSDMLNSHQNKNDHHLIFTIDLFKSKNSKGKNSTQEECEEDYIEIERENNLDKVKSMMDNFKIDDNQEDGGDDLLSLMDQATNKL